MPVTHGVRGSSPLRTAKEEDRKVFLFCFVVMSLGASITSTLLYNVGCMVNEFPTYYIVQPSQAIAPRHLRHISLRSGTLTL